MKTRTIPHPTQALLLAAGGLLASSCGFEPAAAPRRYELSEATATALADYPDLQAQVLGSLEMLFGTPADPAYMRTSDWVDEGFDPNWPTYADDDGGSGEFGEEALEAMFTENERRFAAELAHIDAERYDEVGPFKSAPALYRRWQRLLADREEIEDFPAESRAFFTEYYPTLADSAELYRQQCLHCHGNAGGGDGPTAPFLNPLPRDYRQGKFKFTAVKDKARPRRTDLHRTLTDGLYGTAMPSFRRFSEAELQGLVDYVRLLSIRGEVEILLALEIEDEEILTPELVVQTYLDVWEKWLEASEFFFAFDGQVPAPTPELLARGREVFMDAEGAQCVTCHGEKGLGDGSNAWKLDENGDRIPAYDDDWGHPIVPRNLVYGVYRGGRRPIDVYRRVYAGINGTPMPALGDSKKPDGSPLYESDELWAVVHYVRSLSNRPDQSWLEPHPLVARDRGHDEHAEGSGQDSSGHGSSGEGEQDAAGHPASGS